MPLSILSTEFSSVTQLYPAIWDPMNHSTPGLPVHHQLLEFTQTHVHWVGDAIQPSHPNITPFSSCPQSFPASGSFLMSQLFASGGQNIGVSASTSVLPMNIQDWFPLGLTDLISSLSKGLSRVFSNTTVQKHKFFGAQLSSQSNSRIHTWLLEKPQNSHVINTCYCTYTRKATKNLFKRLILTAVVKNGKQLGSTYIVDGNLKWYKHFGKQFDRSSQS